MLTPSAETRHGSAAAAEGPDLEGAVAAVELHLASLTDALRERDPVAVERHADLLHRALSAAVHTFMHAARHGGAPESLRLRLARASAQVARQRELLARATAALDRAIDLLLPDATPAGRVYNAAGLTEPLIRRGSLNA